MAVVQASQAGIVHPRRRHGAGQDVGGLCAYSGLDADVLRRIQIASVLGYLGSEALQIYPSLVIVPNSCVTY